MKARNRYILPVALKDLVKVDRTTSPAHSGKLKNSVDFLFTDKLGDFSVEGKPIFAAASGEIVFTRDASRLGGPHKKFLKKGNGIMIRHARGEFSYYEHLKFRGVLVKKGSHVKAGDMIGYSGNTGYTFLSHLHFHVLRFTGPGKEDFEALEVRFKELDEKSY